MAAELPDPPVGRDEVLEILTRAGARPDVAALYVDAYLEYVEAAENIRINGAICAHPRTGNPIDNPYLGVRDRARSALLKWRIPPAAAARLWALEFLARGVRKAAP